MHNIYILLTRSPSIVSRAISYSTGDDYTHSSLAYDDKLYTLCSFARRYTRLPLPGGLVREKLEGGFYEIHKDIPCALLSLCVSESVYRSICEKVDGMLLHRKDFHYDVRGLILCRMGRESKRDNHYFCSRFVGEVLLESGAVQALPKPASLMHPQDFLDLDEVTVVYEGLLSGLVKPVRKGLFPQKHIQSAI